MLVVGFVGCRFLPAPGNTPDQYEDSEAEKEIDPPSTETDKKEDNSNDNEPPAVDLTGAWTNVTHNPDGPEVFVYTLTFFSSVYVNYDAGWYLSEIAVSYVGSYTIENNDTLKLNMSGGFVDEDDVDTLIAVFSFTVTGNTLILTKQSGDALTYLYETGVPMEFTKVP